MTLGAGVLEGRTFDETPRTPGGHFDLYLQAALIRLQEQLPGLQEPDGRAAFPFLREYLDRLPDWTRETADAWARWCAAIEVWEDSVSTRLPLRTLRDVVSLDHLALTILFTAGLVDEDSRFGAIFSALQRETQRRPTMGVLSGWATYPADRRAARASIARLLDVGMLQPIADDLDTADAAIRPTPALWDVLRGGLHLPSPPWARYRPAEDADPLGALIVPAEVRRRLEALATRVEVGGPRCVVIRGPGWSGRRTLLASLARSMGYGSLEVDAAALDERQWLALGPLATALHALPIIRVEPGVGETVAVPPLRGLAGVIGVTLPPHGGVHGPDVDQSVTLGLRAATPGERRRHWRDALDPGSAEDLDTIADRYRLGGGAIRRVARIASSNARLDGRTIVRARDVQEASRTLRSRALETLAAFVPTAGDWSDLVTDDETRVELGLLEQRCRAREGLLDVLSPAIGLRSAGVRVLFTGPSGTGKTLAARLLAAVLEMDLYALRLSSVVDKYLGETEKNLSAVFARAAELDAILLLDEGDALLTRRTDVSTSNDRYANLQTNHLLQLLESHEGIVIITTNAGDRIDGAFQRRIDVVVEFRAPDASQRWDLWLHHLPDGHTIDPEVLADVSARCKLSGGQIRNAVLHAWLLAFEHDSGTAGPTTLDVETAIRREYRKMGAVCPLQADRAGP
jgi:hypothetical protein